MTYGSYTPGHERIDMWEPAEYCTQCGCGLSAIDIANHWRICQWCAREERATELAEYAHDDIGQEEYANE